MDATHHQLPLREEAKDDRPHVLTEEEKDDGNDQSLSVASQSSTSSTRSKICHLCEKNCYDRKRLLKHMNKEHRKDYVEKRDFCEPHVVPEGAKDFEIIKPFMVGQPPPFGYSTKQLPLLLISYTLGIDRVSRVLVDYKTFIQRYPKEMCRAFMQATILVPRSE